MKLILTILSLITLGVNTYAFPYIVNTANIKASQVSANFTNFNWNMSGGSDQSFVLHTDQQGISKVILRFGITQASTNYPLQWETTEVSLTSTGTIFQGYLSRTSLPPNRVYYAEFAAFIGTNQNSAGMGIGRGRINVTASLFTDSNYTTQIIQQVTGGITSETDPVYLADKSNLVLRAGSTMSGNLGFTNSGLSSVDFIDYDLAPTSSIIQGRSQWESSRNTLRLGLNANVNLDEGQQLVLYAKAIETNTINKGEVVYIAGALGDNPTIKRASNESELKSSRTIGIAAENISSNANGFVVTAGTIYNLNTSGFVQGAPLYLGANGTMQTNLPVAPLHGLFIGTVERVGSNNGQIFVHIQNYQELEELSDVNIHGVSNRDLISWNSASNRWQNYSLSSLGIATGLPVYSESDPIFIAASNSFTTRITANTTGKVDLAIYTPATSALWTAIGGIVSADNALTNVTASGRITATKTGAVVALTFDASGLATGMPIYAFIETDTTATNRLTNYYTITQANGIFSTGTPIYTEAQFIANSNRITLLEGYTNRSASALSSSVWASVDSTTNYVKRNGDIVNGMLSINETSSTSLSSNYALRLKHRSLTASEMNTDIFATTGGLNRATTGHGIATIYDSINFSEIDPIFASNSNRITVLEGYTNRAASALSSSVWASADSTTNYASRVAFNSATNFLNNKFANYLPLAGGEMDGNLDLGGNDINNASSINFGGSAYIGGGNIFYGLWEFSEQPYIPSYLTTSTWASADSTTNYASRIQFVSASNSFNTSITALNGYTNRAASALASSVWASADSTTNYTSRESFNSFTSSYATADATTNYASRVTFNATSNALNSSITSLQARVVYTTNLSAIAGSGLGVTSNQLVVTNVASYQSSYTGIVSITGINASTTPSNLLIRAGNRLTVGGISGNLYLDGGTDGAGSWGYVAITSSTVVATTIQGVGLGVDGTTNGKDLTISGGGGYTPHNGGNLILRGGISAAVGTNGHIIVQSRINMSGNAITNISLLQGNASGLTNFPSSLLTISAAQSNYWQITTAPVSNSSFGQRGHLAVSSSNVFIYSPDALGTGTGRWIRISGDIGW